MAAVSGCCSHTAPARETATVSAACAQRRATAAGFVREKAGCWGTGGLDLLSPTTALSPRQMTERTRVSLQLQQGFSIRIAAVSHDSHLVAAPDERHVVLHEGHGRCGAGRL